MWVFGKYAREARRRRTEKLMPLSHRPRPILQGALKVSHIETRAGIYPSNYTNRILLFIPYRSQVGRMNSLIAFTCSFMHSFIDSFIHKHSESPCYVQESTLGMALILNIKGTFRLLRALQFSLRNG